MDWVETTGKSIEEATDRALAHLGVHRDDAEVEVIEEPKAGLFGRVRGEARVRARVRPSGPRPKRSRRSGGREERPRSNGPRSERPRAPRSESEPRRDREKTAARRQSTRNLTVTFWDRCSPRGPNHARLIVQNPLQNRTGLDLYAVESVLA